jgi:hypothetical protein
MNGAAFCWGRNTMGQLGNGGWAADSTGSGGQDFQAPAAVVGELRFSQLSAGEQMTCGVTLREGAVYCWGYGGQTGDANECSERTPFVNTPCNSAIPSRVLPEDLPGSRIRPQEVRFVRVDAGSRLACAVSMDGGAWCWGNNYRCALGRCKSSASSRAHQIHVPGQVVEIGAGYWHACARTADHRVFCWGDNRSGQLGSLATVNAGSDGLPPDYRDTTDAAVRTAAWRTDPCFLGGRCSPAAVEVEPRRRWTALTVGTNHACALAEDDGGVYCWGGTDSAALGLDARLVLCENRSASWKDARCQPTPVRVAGLPRLITRPDAGAHIPGRASQRRLRDSMRVLVSRREVRVIFPRDTARAWGWSASIADGYVPSYYWGVMVGSMDVPRIISLRVDRTKGRARDFPSLERLVAEGRAQSCVGGTIGVCTNSGLTARVDSGRVVFILTDSLRIASLFGLRPEWVRPWRLSPEEPFNITLDSVRVEYVAPQIPMPDSTLRAEAARRLRAYEDRVTWTNRYIDGGLRGGGAIWLVVGDSTEVQLVEDQCVNDVCYGRSSVVPDSGWAVADTSIAHVHTMLPGTDRSVFHSSTPAVYLVARRPGRTTLRARGLHGAPTMSRRNDRERGRLSLDVVVAPGIGQVEIEPHADIVSIRKPLELSVRVVDDAGNPLEHAPVSITLIDGPHREVRGGNDPMTVYFATPGRRMLIAAFGGRADTSYVNVVERDDCRFAEQAVHAGQTGPTVQWAWDIIHTCPEAGSATAAALRQLRTDDDTAHFTPAIRVGFVVRDAELFTAALNLASDRSATPTAREAGFIILIYQLTVDRTVTFDGLSEATDISGCPLGSLYDRGVPTTRTPLPADASARAGSVARAVAENPEEPEVVRVAADCITQAIRQHSLWQP